MNYQFSILFFNSQINLPKTKDKLCLIVNFCFPLTILHCQYFLFLFCYSYGILSGKGYYNVARFALLIGLLQFKGKIFSNVHFTFYSAGTSGPRIGYITYVILLQIQAHSYKPQLYKFISSHTSLIILVYVYLLGSYL